MSVHYSNIGKGGGSWYDDFKNSIRKFEAGEDYFSNILSQAVKAAVHDIGQQHDFNERSGNLVDSIGGCVIINGSLRKDDIHFARPQKCSKPHKGWDKAGIEANTGRGYLMEYFDNLKAECKGIKGFRVYIVAAAYYGQIIEEGKQTRGGRTPNPNAPLGRKYRVITMSSDYLKKALDETCAKYNKAFGLNRKGGIRNFIISRLGTTYNVGTPLRNI